MRNFVLPQDVQYLSGGKCIRSINTHQLDGVQFSLWPPWRSMVPQPGQDAAHSLCGHPSLHNVELYSLCKNNVTKWVNKNKMHWALGWFWENTGVTISIGTLHVDNVYIFWHSGFWSSFLKQAQRFYLKNGFKIYVILLLLLFSWQHTCPQSTLHNRSTQLISSLLHKYPFVKKYWLIKISREI